MKNELNHEELHAHYEWLLQAGTLLINSEDHYRWKKGADYLAEARKLSEEHGWE